MNVGKWKGGLRAVQGFSVVRREGGTGPLKIGPLDRQWS